MERKLNFLENLIHIHRYSGNLLIKPETVADHVVCMNALAMEFVPKLNDKFAISISLSDIIYGIALHDIDETVSTDIPRNFKYSSKELATAIKTATKDAIQNSGLDKLVLDDISYFTNHDTEEGFLIKLFDVTQAGYKMIQEIQLGNSYFLDELNNVIDYLANIDSVLNDEESVFGFEFNAAMIWLRDLFVKEFIDLATPFGFNKR